MRHQQLQKLKRMLRRLWVFSPERLWLAAIALSRDGHWVLAFWLKHLNGLIYHNSLSSDATVSPDVWLAHNGLGIVVNANVEIGRRVAIWHHVTLAAGRPERRGGDGEEETSADGARGWVGRPQGELARIVVEDSVVIGAGAIVIAPRGRTLTIGRRARVGAGVVVTQDVPAGATVVGPGPRLLTDRERASDSE
jgi:serine O-acetyltransferase